MRNIYMRFYTKNPLSFRTQQDHGRTKYCIRNIGGYQIVLVEPKLRMSILRGVFFQDTFGNHDKWVSDVTSNSKKAW